MLRFTNTLALIALGATLAACGSGNSGMRTDGGGHGDGALGDSYSVLPDGRIVPNDGFTVLPDGHVVPVSDGSSTSPDGTSDGTSGNGDGTSGTDDTGIVTLPDGSMVYPDGAQVTDSGSTTGPDGGTGCGPTEICANGIDDNCNGMIDENCACLPGATQRCYPGLPSQAGVGVCTYGMSTCTGSGEFGSWGVCMGAGSPQPVVCGGGMDYRCDGMIDEGCGCTPGMSQACYDGPAGTDGVGLCHSGTQTCVMMGSGANWGPCMGEVTPTAPICDGMDHACTGMASTGCNCVAGTSRPCYDGPTGTAGVGLCRSGTQRCMAGSSGSGADWGACTGETLPTPDTCDGLDHQCRGMAGVGCPCIIGNTRPCYDGPGGTRMVGVCHDGTQSCVMMGSSAGWGGTCAGERLPGSEVCGNGLDDNCNGQVDEGCGGMLTCPGNQMVPAGTPIMLTAMGSGLTSYTWTIVAAPTGGASTATWAPSPPNAMTEQFTPFIVGDYTIRIDATDSGGMTHSCMFTVTAEPHGLRVQLTWNGTGDLDLHLHSPNTGTGWFTSPDDCYYADRSPPWGANLDFDNTSANGPENDRVDSPAIGQTYRIAVHNYCSGDGRIATIQIFCGSTMGTTPTATFNSTPMTGGGCGNCGGNGFWKVADVRFTSATTCVITPLNRYSAASAACGGAGAY